jgi:metal-sulfur cluster biosynthetic enzyme
MATKALQPSLTEAFVWDRLRTVLDPETNINVVDMGFIYQVTILSPAETNNGHTMVRIRYTLTTPACPLAGALQGLIHQSLAPAKDASGPAPFDPEQDVVLELTFDPPWSLGHMSEEARAELGF